MKNSHRKTRFCHLRQVTSSTPPGFRLALLMISIFVGMFPVALRLSDYARSMSRSRINL